MALDEAINPSAVAWAMSPVRVMPSICLTNESSCAHAAGMEPLSIDTWIRRSFTRRLVDSPRFNPGSPWTMGINWEIVDGGAALSSFVTVQVLVSPGAIVPLQSVEYDVS